MFNGIIFILVIWCSGRLLAAARETFSAEGLCLTLLMYTGAVR